MSLGSLRGIRAVPPPRAESIRLAQAASVNKILEPSPMSPAMAPAWLGTHWLCKWVGGAVTGALSSDCVGPLFNNWPDTSGLAEALRLSRYGSTQEVPWRIGHINEVVGRRADGPGPIVRIHSLPALRRRGRVEGEEVDGA